MTVQDLIKSALRKIGVIASGETPKSEEYTDALEVLNLMLQAWSATMSLEGRIKTSITLTSGKGSYTWGASGDESTARPVRILGITYKDTSGVETPLLDIGGVEYKSISDKTTSGQPAKYFYNPTIANGTLYLYPVPDTTGATVEVDSVRPLGDLALTDTVTLPAEMRRAIVIGLGVELAPEYGIQVSPFRIQGLVRDLSALMGNTLMQTMSELKLPEVKSYYDIRTDE